MSRWAAGAGVVLATACGVLISYSTLQPELKRQQAERTGEFQEQRAGNDTVISRAIMSDLKAAEQEVVGDGSKGIAWGLREAMFGKSAPRQPGTATPMTNAGTREADKTEQGSRDG